MLTRFRSNKNWSRAGQYTHGKGWKWGTWGRCGWAAAAGAGASRARAWDGRLRGGALGGPLRARLAARRNRGGVSDAPIVDGGGVLCGGAGLPRLAAAGHAPRLRRTGGGGVPTGRVRFPVTPSRWAAALTRPQVHTGGTLHDKHAPCACMRPLRVPCVPSLCAHFGSSLCVPALRTSACPYCVHGVHVQFVVHMCVLEPMPAARDHAVRARAVRLRAGRVVHLCSVHPIVRHPLVNVVDIAGERPKAMDITRRSALGDRVRAHSAGRAGPRRHLARGG
jgi:hypothetical protein